MDVDHLACAPPARTRALSSRRSAERPTRLTLRHRPSDAPLRVCWTPRVVVRAVETAAFVRFVKNERRASIQSVFRRNDFVGAIVSSLALRRCSKFDRSRRRRTREIPFGIPFGKIVLRRALRPCVGVLTWPRATLARTCVRSRNHVVPYASASRRERTASDLGPAASPPRFRDPTSIRSRGFHPSPLVGRCSAPVSFGVARSDTTSSFDFCRNFDRGHEPYRKSRPRPPLPRGRAAEPSFTRRRTTECRSLPEPGSRGAWLPMQRSRMRAALRPLASPRAVRFRSTIVLRRSPRERGPVTCEPRNPTRRRIEPPLETSPNTLRRRRRACRGLEPRDTFTPSTEAHRRRRLREERRLFASQGAIDRRSLVRAPKRTNPRRCMLERVEAHRL